MGAKNDCKTFTEELAWVDRIYWIPFFRSLPGLRLTHSWNFYCWAVLRACLLKLQMTESQESLKAYWRTGLVLNLDQKKKWVEEITIHSGEGNCKLSHSGRMNTLRRWCKVLQKISRVQGMSNQSGDKNVVLPNNSKEPNADPGQGRGKGHTK